MITYRTFSRSSQDTIGICLWVDAIAEVGGERVAVAFADGLWQALYRCDQETMLEIEQAHQRLLVEDAKLQGRLRRPPERTEP